MQVEKSSGVYMVYAFFLGVLLLLGISLYYLPIWVVELLGVTSKSVHISRMLYWCIVIPFFIVIIFTIWVWVFYSNLENDVKAVFSTCPLCGSSDTKAILYTTKAEIECLECGAQWIVTPTSTWMSGKLKTAKLVHPSKDR